MLLFAVAMRAGRKLVLSVVGAGYSHGCDPSFSGLGSNPRDWIQLSFFESPVWSRMLRQRTANRNNAGWPGTRRSRHKARNRFDQAKQVHNWMETSPAAMETWLCPSLRID